jgi:hydrogenase maturation protease
MNRTLVDRVVDAVLYEGYILYPYRPSVKNRQRWTFGGLYPAAYCRTQGGSDAPSNQTECLVEGNAQTTLDVAVRFLHLIERVVGKTAPPLAEWPEGTEPPFQLVEELRIGETVFHPWQEAEERRIELPGVALSDILERPRVTSFAFPGRRWLEPLREATGEVGGILVRKQQGIEGAIELEAARAAEGLFKVTLRVVNRTPLNCGVAELVRVRRSPNSHEFGYPAQRTTSRDDALLRSLISTHTILGTHGGAFVSLLDPPGPWQAVAAACRNVGTWPVLVGEEGARDTLLSSPIILYDYPQVAPESAGDLFEATEIDEILTLRILTLTEEEKRTAAALDPRARELLARTESLAREQLASLHGSVRTLRSVSEETP